MAPACAAASPPLFAVDRRAFEGFDLRLELRRLCWSAVAVLATVLVLVHAADAAR